MASAACEKGWRQFLLIVNSHPARAGGALVTVLDCLSSAMSQRPAVKVACCDLASLEETQPVCTEWMDSSCGAFAAIKQTILHRDGTKLHNMNALKGGMSLVASLSSYDMVDVLWLVPDSVESEATLPEHAAICLLKRIVLQVQRCRLRLSIRTGKPGNAVPSNHRFHMWARALGTCVEEVGNFARLYGSLLWRGVLYLPPVQGSGPASLALEVFAKADSHGWHESLSSRACVLRVLSRASFPEIRHFLVPSHEVEITFSDISEYEELKERIHGMCHEDLPHGKDGLAVTALPSSWIVALEEVIDEGSESPRATPHGYFFLEFDGGTEHGKWSLWRIDFARLEEIVLRDRVARSTTENSGPKHPAVAEPVTPTGSQGLLEDCNHSLIYGISHDTLASQHRLDRRFMEDTVLFSSLSEVMQNRDLGSLPNRSESQARGSELRSTAQNVQIGSGPCRARQACKRRLSDVSNTGDVLGQHVYVQRRTCGKRDRGSHDRMNASPAPEQVGTCDTRNHAVGAEYVAFDSKPWLRSKSEVFVPSKARRKKKKFKLSQGMSMKPIGRTTAPAVGRARLANLSHHTSLPVAHQSYIVSRRALQLASAATTATNEDNDDVQTTPMEATANGEGTLSQGSDLRKHRDSSLQDSGKRVRATESSHRPSHKLQAKLSKLLSTCSADEFCHPHLSIEGEPLVPIVTSAAAAEIQTLQKVTKPWPLFQQSHIPLDPFHRLSNSWRAQEARIKIAASRGALLKRRVWGVEFCTTDGPAEKDIRMMALEHGLEKSEFGYEVSGTAGPVHKLLESFFGRARRASLKSANVKLQHLKDSQVPRVKALIKQLVDTQCDASLPSSTTRDSIQRCLYQEWKARHLKTPDTYQDSALLDAPVLGVSATPSRARADVPCRLTVPNDRQDSELMGQLNTLLQRLLHSANNASVA